MPASPHLANAGRIKTNMAIVRNASSSLSTERMLQFVSQLKRERDQIDKAIEALEGLAGGLPRFAPRKKNKETKMDLFDKAKHLASEAAAKIGDVAEDAKNAAQHAGEAAMDKAAQAGDAIKDAGSAALHSNIAQAAADKLGDAKDAVTDAGSSVIDQVKSKLG